jgi:hypothetical protein
MPGAKHIWPWVLGAAILLSAGWWIWQSKAPPPDGDQFPYVAAARTALATRMDAQRSEIDVVSITAKEWGDTSLGCPEEGKSYLQIITSGYIVILEYKGEWYTYHTDEIGRAVTC